MWSYESKWKICKFSYLITYSYLKIIQHKVAILKYCWKDWLLHSTEKRIDTIRLNDEALLHRLRSQSVGQHSDCHQPFSVLLHQWRFQRQNSSAYWSFSGWEATGVCGTTSDWMQYWYQKRRRLIMDSTGYIDIDRNNFIAHFKQPSNLFNVLKNKSIYNLF